MSITYTYDIKYSHTKTGMRNRKINNEIASFFLWLRKRKEVILTIKPITKVPRIPMRYRGAG